MFAVAFDLGRAAKQVLTLGQTIMGKAYQDMHAALVILGVELIELDIVSMKPSSRTRIEVERRTAILGKLITNPNLNSRLGPWIGSGDQLYFYRICLGVVDNSPGG